jgi:hypothetical protein
MNYDNAYLSCQIHTAKPVSLNGVPRLHIQGTIKNRSTYSKIFLIAPNPPMSMTNYSGSGLPYPCANQAFENTLAYLDIHETSFETTIFYPNSYYAVGGFEKIPPSIFIGFIEHSSITPTYVRLELQDILPLRTLTHRSARKGPEFYANKASIIGVPDSQEALLRMIGNVKINYGVA